MKGQRGFVRGFVQANRQHPTPALPLADVLRRSVQRIGRWYQLGQQRRALAALSDGALKDLGLSRADIFEESERPFWDDPLRK